MIIRDPFTNWLKWWIRTAILLHKSKGKNLKIGYMTSLTNVSIGNFNTFYDNVTIIDSIIDDYVYVGNRSRIINASIGRFCSIGGDVKIGLGKHPVSFISTFPAFFSNRMQCQISFSKENLYKESERIIIGNDVWVGENSIIMDNVKIGNGAVIAAGSIVTRDVEPYTIVGGVPARHIKNRFEPFEIENLEKFKWWNKDISWIKENYQKFNVPSEFFNFIRKD